MASDIIPDIPAKKDTSQFTIEDGINLGFGFTIGVTLASLCVGVVVGFFALIFMASI